MRKKIALIATLFLASLAGAQVNTITVPDGTYVCGPGTCDKVPSESDVRSKNLRVCAETNGKGKWSGPSKRWCSTRKDEWNEIAVEKKVPKESK